MAPTDTDTPQTTNGGNDQGRHAWLELSLRATKIKNTDGFMGRKIGHQDSKNNLKSRVDNFFGASDPFFRLETLADDNHTSQVIAQSEVMINTLKPTWPVVKVDLQALTQMTDENVDALALTAKQFRIVVYDWEKDGEHQYIGALTTNVDELVQKADQQAMRKNGASFELRHERKNKAKKEFRGNLFVTSVRVTYGAPPPPPEAEPSVTSRGIAIVPLDPSEHTNNDASMSSMGHVTAELVSDDADEDEKPNEAVASSPTKKAVAEKEDARPVVKSREIDFAAVPMKVHSEDETEDVSDAKGNAVQKIDGNVSGAKENSVKDTKEVDALNESLRKVKGDIDVLKNDLEKTNQEAEEWQPNKQAAEADFLANKEAVLKIKQEIDQYKQGVDDLLEKKIEEKSPRDAIEEAEAQQTSEKTNQAPIAKEHALEQYNMECAERDSTMNDLETEKKADELDLQFPEEESNKIKNEKEAALQSQVKQECEAAVEKQDAEGARLSDRDKLTEISKESEAVRMVIEEETKTLTELIEKHDALVKEIEAKRASLEEASSQLEGEVRKLQDKVEADKQAQQAKTDKYEKELAEQKVLSDKVTAKLQALEAETRELEEKLEETNRKKDSVETEFQALETQAQEAEDKLKGVKSKKETAEAGLQALETETREVEEKLEGAKAKKERIESILLAIDTETNEMEEKLADARAKKESAVASFVALETETSALEEKLAEAKTKKEIARVSFLALGKETSDMAEKAEKTRLDKEAADAEYKRKCDELEKLKQDLEQKRLEVEQSKSSLKDMDEEVQMDREKEDMDSKQWLVDHIYKAKETATEEYTKANAKLEKIQQDTEVKRLALETATAQLAEIVLDQEKLNAARLDNDKAQQEYDKLQTDLEAFKKQIEATRVEIEGVSKRAVVMAKSLQETQDKFLKDEEATRQLSEKIDKLRLAKQEAEESYAKESASLDKLVKKAGAKLTVTEEEAIRVGDEIKKRETKEKAEGEKSSIQARAFQVDRGGKAFKMEVSENGVSTSRGINLMDIGPSTTRPKKVSEDTLEDSTSFWLVLLVIILLAIALSVVHSWLCEPIELGDVIRPGSALYKNGLLGMLPAAVQPLCTASGVDCDKTHLLVHDKEVTVYDNNGNMTWKILGDHRSAKRVCNVGDDESCEHGLHFTEDGHLILSGIKIQWIEAFEAKGHGELHPWPFEEEPLARTWKVKK